MESFASTLVARAAEKFQRKEYAGACADYERLLQVPDVASTPEARASCLRNLAVCYTNAGNMGKMVSTFETMLAEEEEEDARRGIITNQLHNNIGFLLVTRFDKSNLAFFELLPTELMITVITQLLLHASKNGDHIIDVIEHAISKKLMSDGMRLWDDCIITVIRFFCDIKDLRVLKLEKLFEVCGELYYCGMSKYWRGEFRSANIMFEICAGQSPPPERDTPLAFYRTSSALRGMTHYQESTVDAMVSEVARVMGKCEGERPQMDDLFFNRFLVTIYDTCRERNPSTLAQEYTAKCVQRLGWCIQRDDFDDSTIHKVDDQTRIVIIKRGVVHAKHSDMLVSISCDKDDPLECSTRALVLGATTHSISQLLRDKTSMVACLLKSGNTHIVKLTGYVFALNITNQVNHYHILCELLTRLAVLKQHSEIPAHEITIILFKGIGRIYIDICRRMGFTKMVFYEDTATYYAEDLLFVDMVPGHVGCLDYLDSWSCFLPSMSGLQTLSKTLKLLFEKTTTTTEPKRRNGESVIFISRGSQGGVRHMRGEKEFIDDILVPLYGPDLVLFDDAFLARSQDPMAAQIELFSNARLIIATHGAGLSNTLFAQPGTKVVEFTLRPNCNRCFEYIAESCNLDYFPCDAMQSFYHGHYEYDEKKGQEIKQFLAHGLGLGSDGQKQK